MSHQHRHAGGGGGGGGDCERGAWDAGKRWDPLRLGAFQGYHGADGDHVDDVGVDVDDGDGGNGGDGDDDVDTTPHCQTTQIEPRRSRPSKPRLGRHRQYVFLEKR